MANTPEINNSLITKAIEDAIQGEVNKKIDELIEASCESFKLKCNDIRSTALTNVMARIWEHFEIDGKEIIIKIPLNHRS